MIGILGRKLGMTQVFDESGRMYPVTVVEAGPCCVIQVKTREKDGYEAVKIGFSEIKKEKNVNKPMGGIFKKIGVKPYKMLKEFPMGDLKVGELVTVEKFNKGDMISVSGVTKGKGFQGVVKRHHYAGGPASHGSMFYRAPGSIGASSFPSRVWKNKGLPGHMGSERTTVKNLKVVDIKAEQNLLLILGAVPGSKGTYLEIRKEN
jgi:large subunit ribosomal protein L3